MTGTWIGMTATNLLLPILMVGMGGYNRSHVSKTISGFVGYRTSRSMKNQETWAFAQQYFGALWWKWGWLLLAASAAIMALLYRVTEGVLVGVGLALMTVQTIVIILSILPTERALKNTFYDDGSRKDGGRNR